MITIDVDFYKTTGKWYAGGPVNVATLPWEEGLYEEICKNQNIISNPEQFHMVVKDVLENMSDKDYHLFYQRLYMAKE